jgi:hypothetical protein
MYKTFTEALLAAVETSEPRANAIKAMEHEPQYQNVNGVRLVIFSTPVFTLIIRKERGEKTWSYHWIWTDAAS